MEKKSAGLSEKQWRHGGRAEQGHQQFLAQGPSDEDAEVLFPVLSKLAIPSSHVFSLRKVGRTQTHTCVTLSESFLKRLETGKGYLRLQRVFLGWVPKLPDSWTITCSFHASLCIYFTEALCLLSAQIHVGNILVSCRSRGSNLETILFRHSTVRVGGGGRGWRGTLSLLPSSCLLLLLSTPLFLSPLTFFFFLFFNSYKHVLAAHVPFHIFVGHFWPPSPSIPMWGRLNISSWDGFWEDRNHSDILSFFS